MKNWVFAVILVLAVGTTYVVATNNLDFNDAFDNRVKIIYLTTMGNISSEKARIAENEIEKFYGINVEFIGKNKLPESAICDIRKRYVAADVLKHLRTLNLGDPTNYNYKILALTNKDIEIEKDNHWGIMGLAFLGGDECVVSTFRLAGSDDRFKKVTLHETGHMLNIDHCKFNVEECFMNDAKGKGATVDKAKIYLCPGCKEKIRF